MAIIPAVVTDVGREYLGKYLGGLVAFETLVQFKYGEGGWIDPGGGPVPRTPDPTLTDIDAILDPLRPVPSQRYPATSWASYAKLFIGGDITFVAPNTIRCRCFLDLAEFNDDGYGNSPEVWELGVFDSGGRMIGYGTFPIQIKDNTKVLDNTMIFTF